MSDQFDAQTILLILPLFFHQLAIIMSSLLLHSSLSATPPHPASMAKSAAAYDETLRKQLSAKMTLPYNKLDHLDKMTFRNQLMAVDETLGEEDDDDDGVKMDDALSAAIDEMAERQHNDMYEREYDLFGNVKQ